MFVPCFYNSYLNCFGSWFAIFCRKLSQPRYPFAWIQARISFLCSHWTKNHAGSPIIEGKGCLDLVYFPYIAMWSYSDWRYELAAHYKSWTGSRLNFTMGEWNFSASIIALQPNELHEMLLLTGRGPWGMIRERGLHLYSAARRGNWWELPASSGSSPPRCSIRESFISSSIYFCVYSSRSREVIGIQKMVSVHWTRSNRCALLTLGCILENHS